MNNIAETIWVEGAQVIVFEKSKSSGEVGELTTIHKVYKNGNFVVEKGGIQYKAVDDLQALPSNPEIQGGVEIANGDTLESRYRRSQRIVNSNIFAILATFLRENANASCLECYKSEMIKLYNEMQRKVNDSQVP